MTPAEKLARARQDLQQLLHSKATLILGTLDETGAPDSGLTPFLYRDGLFYVYLSQLARHTAQLQRDPRVSLLIHGGDDSTPNPFTDKRFSAQAEASPVGADVDPILDAMSAKLGQTLQLLRGLPDFSLYALRPRRGRLVVGFGAAFEVDPADLKLTHLDETVSGSASTPGR